MVAVEKKYHRDFAKDLESLDRRERELVLQRVEAVATGNLTGRPLSGSKDCFKVRIGDLRLLYVVVGNDAWFMIVDRRGRVYDLLRRRFMQVVREIQSGEVKSEERIDSV